MSDISCLSCVHFKAQRPESPERGGACRRFPPTAVFMGFQQSPLPGAAPTPLLQSVMPFVGKNDLCGEHPFMAAMRGSKIPVLGEAMTLRNPPSVHAQGNGAAAPPGGEVADLVDSSDADVVRPEKQAP